MNTIIFRGAFIRYFDFRKGEAGWFARAHMTAEFTDRVAEAMQWGAPPAGCTAGKLEGSLNATHMVLTPNARELKQHELQLDCNQVGDFEFFRVTENESARTELRFKISTPVEGAEGILGAYARRIGQSASQLRVGYAKQEELDLTPGAEETQEEGDKPKANAAVAGVNGQSVRSGSGPKRERAEAERRERAGKLDQHLDHIHGEA
jgi:hypothetical protein